MDFSEAQGGSAYETRMENTVADWVCKFVGGGDNYITEIIFFPSLT